MESGNTAQSQSDEDKLKELGKCCLNCAFLQSSFGRIDDKYRLPLLKGQFEPIGFSKQKSPIKPFCILALHSKEDVRLIGGQDNSPLIRKCSTKCEPFLSYYEYENLDNNQLWDERTRLLSMQNAEAAREMLEISKGNLEISQKAAEDSKRSTRISAWAVGVSLCAIICTLALGLIDYNGDKQWQKEQIKGFVGVQEAVKANGKSVSDGISKSNSHLDSLRNTANNLESIERTQVQNQQAIIERLTEKVAGLELQLENLQNKLAIGDEAGDATEQ